MYRPVGADAVVVGPVVEVERPSCIVDSRVIKAA